jgi:hypothetical protein
LSLAIAALRGLTILAVGSVLTPMCSQAPPRFIYFIANVLNRSLKIGPGVSAPSGALSLLHQTNVLYNAVGSDCVKREADVTFHRYFITLRKQLRLD